MCLVALKCCSLLARSYLLSLSDLSPDIWKPSTSNKSDLRDYKDLDSPDTEGANSCEERARKDLRLEDTAPLYDSPADKEDVRVLVDCSGSLEPVFWRLSARNFRYPGEAASN